MKRISLFITVLLLCIGSLSAQMQNPVSFSYSVKKLDATNYELHISATVQEGWHLYSQTTPTGGPVATVVSFKTNPLVQLSGTVKEVGRLEQHFEKLFNVDVKQYSNKVDFVQLIKLKKQVRTNMMGSIEFMVCNDQECLPVSKKTFSISINP